MKVLLVSDFVPPVAGGSETYVAHLAAELALRGHEVHVATLTPHPEPAHPAVRYHPVRSLAGRLIRHEMADRPFAPPLPDPVAHRMLAQVLETVGPDIVHAHSWLGVSLPRLKGVPLVWTAHEFGLICQLRTLWMGDGTPCSGPRLDKCVRCGSASYGWAKSGVLAPATVVGRRLLHPDTVLVLSERVRAALVPFVRAPVEVIPGLVPAAGRAEVIPGLPEEPFALFAGDPRPHKGIDVLLRAWTGTRPGGLRLVIAAARPDEVAAPEGVTVTSVPRSAMHMAWGRATVAVVPSIWEEPFGMVAAEALSAGTPVVASAVGALPEIVQDDVNGLLVPPGDADALASAVARLATDEVARRRMSDAAVRSADRYAPDKVVPQIEAVYARLLDR